MVTSVDIEDSGINLSDHCAVVSELNLPLENQQICKSQSKPKVCCYKWRWDKADLWNYNLRTFECLSAIEVPLYLMYVEYGRYLQARHPDCY